MKNLHNICTPNAIPNNIIYAENFSEKISESSCLKCNISRLTHQFNIHQSIFQVLRSTVCYHNHNNQPITIPPDLGLSSYSSLSLSLFPSHINCQHLLVQFLLVHKRNKNK